MRGVFNDVYTIYNVVVFFVCLFSDCLYKTYAVGTNLNCLKLPP